MKIFRRKKSEEPIKDKKNERYEKLLQDRVEYLLEEHEYHQQCDAYHVHLLVEFFSGRTEGDLTELVLEEALRHRKAKKEMQDKALYHRKLFRDRYSEEHLKEFDVAYARADEIFKQELNGHFTEEGKNARPTIADEH